MAKKNYDMTGLNVRREGTTYTFSWLWAADCAKPADHWAELQYVILKDDDNADESLFKKTDRVVKVSHAGGAKGATSYSITLSTGEFYPSTLTRFKGILWRVRYSTHAWAVNTYTTSAPKAPVLSISGKVASWAVSRLSTDSTPFIDTEYETISSDASEAKETDWSSATNRTGDATGSVTLSAPANKVGWIRIRSRGLAGASDWVYQKAYFGTPYAPRFFTAEKKGTSATVIFNYTASEMNYFDTLTVQYCIGVPSDNMGLPASPSWRTGAILGGAKKSGSVTTTFTVGTVPEDQGIWFRGVTKGNGEAEGTPGIGWMEKLKAPTFSDCTWDTATQTVDAVFTNRSAVPDARIALVFSDGKVLVSGGTTSLTAKYSLSPNITEATFGIFAYVGDPNSNPKARSETVWQTTDVTTPQAPAGLSGQESDITPGTPSPTPASASYTTNGEVALEWLWSWPTATGVLLSWSDNINAWTSTDEPSEYLIRSRTTRWLVSGLDRGKTWYFKIRLVKLAENSTQNDEYGPWSEMIRVDLTSAPEIPSVALSARVIKPGDPLTVTWGYVSTDDTVQTAATIYVDGEAVANIEGAVQSYTYVPSWTAGEDHAVSVKTVSASGHSSTSGTVSVSVAEAPVISVSTNLAGGKLTAMPLICSVTGAGVGGQTLVSIVRDGAYRVQRPDGQDKKGFDGETVYTGKFSGEIRNLSIAPSDLGDKFDDGGYYRLISIVQDTYGQRATSEELFRVEWTHQAEAPTAEIITDRSAVIIYPIAPEGYEEGDICDIYRLSADPPELIVSGAEYGQGVVDLYPASEGGYRIVDVTADGDYIGSRKPAWTDYEHGLKFSRIILDYAGGQIELPYNNTVMNTWTKDFRRTTYLNGSVQGDWNKGVNRDAMLSTVTVRRRDKDKVSALRALASSPQVCHVRTPDGSSYAADVQISESSSYSDLLVSFDITVQKVDSEAYDAIKVTDWERHTGVSVVLDDVYDPVLDAVSEKIYTEFEVEEE